MPTSTNVTNLKINELTEAQYDAAVQGGFIGANEISILTDAEAGQVIQVTTLPTASADELDNIYQFIGTTDANYTNGYFYKCVSDGADPATYSWAQTNVQPAPSGLPDQTDNAGKFLTTDGTDASWATINALQNSSTGTDGLSIGSPSSSNYTTVIGLHQYVSPDVANGTSIGYAGALNIGSSNGIAIGAYASVGAEYAIQIGGGQGTNYDSNTFKVANANGNFELMSADGTIPKERLVNAITTPSTMPELTVAGWSNNTQTVTVTGMTATNTVFVSPAPASATDYAAAGIVCTSQGTDSLTFTCTTVPTNAITVNVVIMG